MYYVANRYCCKRCRYKFGECTITYLGKLKIHLNITAHLLYLFTLGVPAYRTRFYVPINLRTVEKAFRLFREAIYDFSLEELKGLKKLSGRLEIDEAHFGGHRKGKRGWGAGGKTMVFGIYKRNGKVVMFPVLDRKFNTLMPLIEKHRRRGSLLYRRSYCVCIIDAQR